MANILTTAGATHIAALDASLPLVNTFDLLIASRGNDFASVADDRSAVDPADEILHSRTLVAAGYPVLGDTDPRNPGASSAWWTWRFDVASGAEGFVASNIVVTNWASGAPSLTEPLLIHAQLASPISKLTPERMTVFINVIEAAFAGAGPTIYSVVDTPDAVPRMHTYTHRARALATYGSSGSQGAQTTAFPGESVFVMALLVNTVGGVLVPGDVQSVGLVVEAQGMDGRWSVYATEAIDPATVLASRRYDDPRWPHPGGYQWSHRWDVPVAHDETAYRLRYTVRQLYGPSTVMVVEVRTGSEVTGVGV